jgi:hypothetical protein
MRHCYSRALTRTRDTQTAPQYFSHNFRRHMSDAQPLANRREATAASVKDSAEAR